MLSLKIKSCNVEQLCHQMMAKLYVARFVDEKVQFLIKMLKVLSMEKLGHLLADIY